MAQPHGRDGLSARRMVVLWTFRAPALCRRVHRAFMRNAWLDYIPILPATACHQSSYFETYSRSRERLQSGIVKEFCWIFSYDSRYHGLQDVQTWLWTHP